MVGHLAADHPGDQRDLQDARSVTVGRISPAQVVKPEAGKTGISTAKTVSSMMPVQKSGMDCPAMVDHVGAEFAGGVGVAGHPDAERDGHHGGQQDRRHGQGDGVRQPVEDDVQGRRLEAEYDVPRLPCNRSLEEDPVLLQERPVEAELLGGPVRAARWWRTGRRRQLAGSPGASRTRTNTVDTVRKIVRMLCAESLDDVVGP